MTLAHQIHDAAWWNFLEELKSFHQKFNSTLVPSKLPQHKALGDWTDRQRRRFRFHKGHSPLSQQQIESLNSTHFQWSSFNKSEHDQWLHQYFKLCSFYLQHNTLKDFAKWANQQRMHYHRGELDQRNIGLLEEICFDWTLKALP
jgi:hypothetical protein